MTLFINNKIEIINTDAITVRDLLQLKNISKKNCAIALNGKLLSKMQWDVTVLSEQDHLTIISAAFGG